MKPILLEVKGFQSFRDVQKIDFDTLTSKGLFGIFGPTGSGKSTILDAIIYALYGKVSKEVQNEYINLNEKDAYVCYTFELSSGHKRRRFIVKRANKKNANQKYGTASVTISEIVTHDDGTTELTVLAEKVREVNELVESLIGLKVEDFTRAVVLPQGKFSEFLKIEPSKRNEMLERIFGLEKYGRSMTDKIKEEGKQNKAQLETKEEIAARYEGVSDDHLKQLQEDLNTLTKQEQEKEAVQKEINETFEEAKVVRGLQEELEKNKQQEQQLLLKEDEIKQKEIQVKRSKQAAVIMPVLQDLNNGEKNLYDTIGNLTRKKQVEQELTAQHSEQQKLFETAKSEKEEKLPPLLIKQHELKETIQDVNLRNELESKLSTGQANLENELVELASIEKSLKEKKEEKINTEAELTLNKNTLDTLHVSTKYRNDILTGVNLENTVFKLQKSISELETEVNGKLQDEKAEQQQLESLEKERTALQENQNEKLAELEIWRVKPILSNEDLQQQQKRISDQENKLNLAVENEEILAKKKIDLDNATAEIQKFKDELMGLNDQRGTLQTIYNETLAKYENLKINNYAGIIAESLGEEDPCPVCGNIHKIQLANKIDQEQLEHYEVEVKRISQQLDEVKAKITSFETQLNLKFDYLTAVRGDFELLSDELNNAPIEKEKEKLNELISQNQQALADKTDAEAKIVELTNTIHGKEQEIAAITAKMAEKKAKLAGLQTQMDEIQQKLEKAKEEMNHAEQELHPLKQDYAIDSFEDSYNEINKKDAQREKIDAQCKILDEKVRELTALAESLHNQQTEKERHIQEITNEVKSWQRDLEGLNAKIYKVCGDKDANLFLKEVNAAIATLENAVKEKEETLQKLAVTLSDVSSQVISLQSTKELQEKNVQSLKERVNQLITEHEFIDAAEVRALYLDSLIIKGLEEEIASHQDQINSIRTLIMSGLEKLKGRTLEEEKWIEINQRKETVESELKELRKVKTGKEKDIERMIKDLEQVRELNKEIKTLKHRQSMLDELNKLLRGNSFIEYISFGQLKYVAKEASNRLMEITKGKYSIILDEETRRFLIRDYTSGGYTRSTDSLSGGELFLTSLSLALALSTHIQLKNSAPLEFFFLDEGFGTLDDNILDTAMTSLEKLHSDKMSIGIISHVKEIQERVPVKLLVTPASSGEGSKVRLAYS